MKTKSLLSLVIALATVACVVPANAAPRQTVKPGLRPVNPPGSWQEIWYSTEGSAGSVITAGNEFYSFTAISEGGKPSSDPNWQYETIYSQGTLILKNIPGAPWYNKQDTTHDEYAYDNLTVVNFTRRDLVAGTMEFRLAGGNEDVMICGTYSGPINPVLAPDDVTVVGIQGQLTTAMVKAELMKATPPQRIKPGLRAVKPPGSWKEMWNPTEGSAGSVITAGNEFYSFTATSEGGKPSSDPNWQYETIYSQGTLILKNIPGAPWYNKQDTTHEEYVFTGLRVLNFTRRDLDAGTMEFRLAGGSRAVMLFGSYSGPIVPILEGGSVVGIQGDLTTALVKVQPERCIKVPPVKKIKVQPVKPGNPRPR